MKQVSAALLFIFCYSIFLFATRPYLDDADDILQAFLNVVLFCIICGASIQLLCLAQATPAVLLAGGRLSLEPKTEHTGQALLIISTVSGALCILYMVMLDLSVYIANKSILVHSKDNAMSDFDKGMGVLRHDMCTFVT